MCSLQESHLRDTGHVIAILRGLQIRPSDVLFTMDIKSLYTNVPIDEGVEVVASLFRDHPDPKRPDRSLLSLLRLLLSTNSFRFGTSSWIQTHGVAMGKTFAGSFANLFMSVWERNGLASFPLRPVVWKRFQDDIFGIWRHDEDSLTRFHTHVNQQHPKIQATLSFGKSVNFLDLTIYLEDNRLGFKLFCKPTDSHMLLPTNSHHPNHTFKGIVYGQILRLATRSSSRAEFDASLTLKSRSWRSQGYTRARIRQEKARVLSLTQQHLDWTTGAFPCGGCDVCRYIAPATSVREPGTPSLFPIFCRITCSSTHVIYMARCSHGHSYVGQTSSTLRHRIKQHLHSIRNGSTARFHQHFRTCDRIDNIRFLGIERVLNNDKRCQRELLWIQRLKCSLNTVGAYRNNKTSLFLPFSNCTQRLANVVRRHCDGTASVRVTFHKGRSLREHLSG